MQDCGPAARPQAAMHCFPSLFMKIVWQGMNVLIIWRWSGRSGNTHQAGVFDKVGKSPVRPVIQPVQDFGNRVDAVPDGSRDVGRIGSGRINSHRNICTIIRALSGKNPPTEKETQP